MRVFGIIPEVALPTGRGEQRCSGLAMTGTQTTDGGSVRKDGNLHILCVARRQSRLPGGENNLVNKLAIAIGRRR